MDRKTPLLTLALLALGTPALASDIDEVSTYDLSVSVDAGKADGEQLQNRSRSSRSGGKRAGSQSSAARPHGAPSAQRTPARPSGAYGRPPAPRPTAAAAASRPGPTVSHTGPRPGTYAHTVTPRPPTGHRPNNVVVYPGGPNRPATVVHRPATVVHRPTVVNRPVVVNRPGVVVHRPVVVNRPGVVVHRPVVVHSAPVRVHTVAYSHVRPYHGVFVYGPRPVAHVHYVDAGPGPVQVERTDLPSRAIDRTNALALGVKGGSLISSTSNGQVYGDPGFGLTGRYRPAESVGLELGVGHHGSAFVDPGEYRSQTNVNGSVELFAFPWARVSPYVLGGVTWNSANLADEVWTGNGYDIATNTDSQFGLHGGLGLELALGNNFALDFEGRYIGWLDERAETEAPGAIQATAGLQFYFK